MMTTAQQPTATQRPLYMDDPDWRLRAMQALRDLGIAVFLIRFGNWAVLAPDVEELAPGSDTKAIIAYAKAIQERAWIVSDRIRKEATAAGATKYYSVAELPKVFDMLGILDIEAGQCRFRESQI